jgi:glucose/arabinose dehydrogenase
MMPARLLFPFALTCLVGCVAPAADGPPPTAALREAPAGSELPGAQTPVVVKTLVDGLKSPWGMDFLPDGSLLITELGGKLKHIDAVTFQATAIANVPASTKTGQGGLMDVLVHPDFERNGLVYLSYTVSRDDKHSTRVSRARLDGSALTDIETLFTAQPFYRERRHFGSRLLLDGGYLFITVGDRGNRELAQSLSTHNGKVIRLLEDGGVPDDNPFVDKAQALPEIWTYGHRNPQGIAVHPRNGQIWVAEHGPRGGDEINALIPGANYGWPTITYGEEYSGGKIGVGTHADGMEQPLVYWVPSIGAGNIDFYTGDLYPGWAPSLLVSGLKLTRIARLELEGDGLGKETRLLANLGMRVRDLQVGPDGLVYALAGGSRLIRLQP